MKAENASPFSKEVVYGTWGLILSNWLDHAYFGTA